MMNVIHYIVLGGVMKTIFVLLIVAITGILSGCGAMGALEEENVELRDKLDSVSTAQQDMKQRVQYLESENIDLDNKNKNLEERVTVSGGLTPPEYVITGENPSYAQPAHARPLYTPQQSAGAATSQNTITVKPQAAGAPQTTSVQPQWRGTPGGEPSQGASLESAPWRAEQQAIQSGATRAHSSDGKWDYGKSGKPQNQNKYGQRFDNRKAVERQEYANPRTNVRGWQNDQVTRRQPAETRTQASVERQIITQPKPRTQVRPKPVESIVPMPPASVSAAPHELRRNAEYNYLEDYQRGLAAYKDGRYSESIKILTSLATRYSVNNMSDNCDFWIAESYRALGKDQNARHYYGRVISYPTSDKKVDARERIMRLP
jgi:TolA-binding protein